MTCKRLIADIDSKVEALDGAKKTSSDLIPFEIWDRERALLQKKLHMELEEKSILEQQIKKHKEQIVKLQALSKSRPPSSISSRPSSRPGTSTSQSSAAETAKSYAAMESMERELKASVAQRDREFSEREEVVEVYFSFLNYLTTDQVLKKQCVEISKERASSAKKGKQMLAAKTSEAQALQQQLRYVEEGGRVCYCTKVLF